jgi:soluble lytic murein transglycosylase-like protein
MCKKIAIYLKIVMWMVFCLYYTSSVNRLIHGYNIGIARLSSVKYFEHIIEASRTHAIDPALVTAVMAAESNFNPNARSYAGAKGLMQINGVTARYLKIKNIYDPRSNIYAGAYYLKELSDRFNGNVTLVLAAYNAGPTAVKRFNGVPPYSETKRYVEKVMRFLHFYKSLPEFSEYI